MTATNRMWTGSKCIAYVDGDALSPNYRRSRGFSGPIVRNGAGDLTLTLTDPIDALNGDLGIFTGINHNDYGTLSVEVVDATHLRVRTFGLFDSSPIAADLDFWILLGEIGPN